MELSFKIDPITRYVQVSYPVPISVPAETTVRCEASFDQGRSWQAAGVWKHSSETARALIHPSEWENGISRGTVIERNAGGLVRTVVWNPFPAAAGNIAVAFRVTLLAKNSPICAGALDIRLDNSDVIVLNDWSNVIQKQFVSANPEPGRAVWWLKDKRLAVREKNIELPQLTYPLNLEGIYAIFVLLKPQLGCIELRLSGDERNQIFNSRKLGEETFWRWTDMARQHLVIRQPYSTVYEYEDEFRAQLDAVRLVPLTPGLVKKLNDLWKADGGKRIVAGYNEPYSWAFYEKVESNLQHWEPLLAFAEARIEIIDLQMGRGGCKMNTETRVGTQLLAETLGDAVRGKTPRTDNVGRMQQYTNMLATQLKYARSLGLKPHANLGATNCYVGKPLESDFSKQHPEWRTGWHLRYEVPEVRRFILQLFEEALQIGAEGLSVDWCRYPNSITAQDTVTVFFRELRALADEYGKKRGRHIDILTRFPARGVTGWQFMDYATWAKEELIDFLCPSNLQARHMNFDISEYRAAVKGTKARLLPAVDALNWGLFPIRGAWLARILKCYAEGADGVYIYQCDGAVLQSPESRRHVSLVGSRDALARWKEREDAEQERYSKGIYINPPTEDDKYHPWERLRVWIEGFRPGTVELRVDDQTINTFQAPPYVLASEEHSADRAVKPGRHALTARAGDGKGWLEQKFDVEFA